MRTLKTPIGRQLQRDSAREREIIRHTLPAPRRRPATPLGQNPTADQQCSGVADWATYWTNRGLWADSRGWDRRRHRKF